MSEYTLQASLEGIAVEIGYWADYGRDYTSGDFEMGIESVIIGTDPMIDIMPALSETDISMLEDYVQGSAEFWERGAEHFVCLAENAYDLAMGR